MSLMEFFKQVMANPSLLVIVILTFGVILVNGWTDAPNAIATCISTRSMSPRAAIVMAAIFNFFGVLVMTMINRSVAQTIFNMVDFGTDSHQALIALSAALFGIVLWAVAAWAFGIPTSESHALIAGLTGAAIALQGNLSGVNWDEWVKIIYGLVFSTVVGFGSGFIVVRIIEAICKEMNRKKTQVFFKNAQIGGAAAMAFMHGAQDGQKFMGVFMLGMALANNTMETDFNIPIWLMVACSLIMGIGTSIGGMRIIKTVGMGMVKLEKHQGFAADAAAASCLLVSSLAGVPVSTTHTKTTAIMGVGAAKRLSSVNWTIVIEMVMAWILTFPGCGLVGYLMAKLFFKLF